MKRHLTLISFVVVLIVGSLLLASCGDQMGTMQGVVTNASDGTPVAKALVVVYGLKKIEGMGQLDAYEKESILRKEPTDDNGAYSTTLEAGVYVVQVWIEGLEVADRMVEVKPGRTLTADFEVTPPSP